MTRTMRAKSVIETRRTRCAPACVVPGAARARWGVSSSLNRYASVYLGRGLLSVSGSAAVVKVKRDHARSDGEWMRRLSVANKAARSGERRLVYTIVYHIHMF